MNQIKVIHTKSEQAKIEAFRPFNVLDRPTLAESLLQARSAIVGGDQVEAQRKQDAADFVQRMKEAKARKREAAAQQLIADLELQERKDRWTRKHQRQLAGRR